MTFFETFNTLELPCDKLLHYFDIYDTWLSKFKGKSPRVLEIGVKHGGSAELWYKHFGEGTHITGVDLNPIAQDAEYLTLLQGNQGDSDFWDTFIKQHGDTGFDIILDDGSHENAHQILTLEKLWPLLRSNGVFLCEDTHTSYYEGVRVKGGGLKNPANFTEYVKNLLDLISDKHTYFALSVGKTPDNVHADTELMRHYEELKSLHFYDSVIVIEKDNNQPPFKRVNSSKDVSYGPLASPAPEDFSI